MRRCATLALMLAAGCGCGVAATDDAGLDAAADAPDGGRDAPTDTPHDTASADTPDTPLDGGPDDPGWISLEGYPTACEIAYATNPSALFLPNWASCEPAALAGCTWLAADARYAMRTTGAPTARHFDGATGHFAVYLGLPSADGELRAVVLARTEGTPLAAFRAHSVVLADGSACTGLAVGMNGAGSAGTAAHFDRDAIDIRHELFHGPLADWDGALPAPITLTPEMVPAGSLVQDLVASDTTAAYQVQPAGLVMIVEAGRSARRGRTTTVGGTPTEMALHEHDVFWLSWYEGSTGSDVWLVHASIDVEAHPLVMVPGSKLWGLGTDGSHLCWIVETERRMGEPYRGDLHCSPYATETSALSPALVRASVPITVTGTVGSGLYALADWDGVDLTSILYVLDIAGGTMRRFVPPSTWRFGVPLWVTPTEIAAPLRVISTTGGAPFDTLVRIDLAAFEDVP